ncbi:Rv2578c family radical SAM protein [Cellulomonas edaphi]|uniref:Rv2578c family radical SAM protein n=1 Tax=Cellulomonas edaphi TaxID=3053468 RepID=A0ABT7S6L3_9CELL|nr:Rv2578c family radical SAM protein [Cellulomons edaphi]MDM7831245.1 Rv2578c family radical SAM protein [Cellulomons edaphi]
MRWDDQRGDEDAALPGLGLRGLVRSVRTPEFAGITFHEVLARSALNKVPEASSMPFRWTVNPFRGCTHACAYCFARPTHEYLDLDAGRDFETQVVVKTNVVEVLRAELSRRTWGRQAVALGTNTDPYQRAEGRYAFMPGIIEALADARTPLSILTKGTLLRRDLALLASAAERVPVGIGVSLAIGDEGLQQAMEPGTPTPRARLDLIRAVRDAGLPCGVMVAPVMPWLTDGRDELDSLLGQLAEAGATGVTILPLHLRGPVKPLFYAWLAEHRPEIVTRYRSLYGSGAYAPREYARWLDQRVRPLLTRHGLTPGGGHRLDAEGSYPEGSMPVAPESPAAASVLQPALF